MQSRQEFDKENSSEIRSIKTFKDVKERAPHSSLKATRQMLNIMKTQAKPKERTESHRHDLILSNVPQYANDPLKIPVKKHTQILQEFYSKM
jgi:DNA topoisomerase IA